MVSGGPPERRVSYVNADCEQPNLKGVVGEYQQGAGYDLYAQAALVKIMPQMHEPQGFVLDEECQRGDRARQDRGQQHVCYLQA